jgi:hypothetical protein
MAFGKEVRSSCKVYFHTVMRLSSFQEKRMSLSRILSSGIWLMSLLCLCHISNGQNNSSIFASIDPIGFIKSEPSESSSTLATLALGDSISVVRGYYQRPYFRVKSGSVEGYISIACLALTCEVVDIIFEQTKRDYRQGCVPLQAVAEGTISKTFHDTNQKTYTTTDDCHKTANCGCSGKRKNECGGPCCRWIVGKGCSCQ